ncbi:tandem-95 repeat protein [Photobacterium rosenbergii]|uniref:Tandem-95 repeat protein n=1 Tax=Photobacterium rosenbergii TaxID=294936 RepID=A0ABU3ZCQ5_9GAMM|nr:tandem-95 repeat protein [Photobacterium rosenbergii]MDV5167887.1 tandem-95 repeat protein [Photobacterium rosenbergii]
MAQDNQNQDKHAPLNNAVEHNATPDGSTDEHRAQDRQNQQNTMASTTATGADAAEQNDQVNGSANESGGENSEGAGRQTVAEDSGSGEAGKSQGQTAGRGQDQSTEPQPQAEGGVDGGIAPQAVGGGAQRNAQPGQEEGQGRAEQNAQGQAQAQDSGASGSANGSGGGLSGQGGEQTPFDTETTSETFQVDVADATSKEKVIDGDFDTETVSETFEIQVDNVNDAVIASDDGASGPAIAPFGGPANPQQNSVIEVNEDGQLVLRPEDLLANDTDADGDVLTITEVSVTDDTHGIVELDESGNVLFTPEPNYHGPAAFEYTVTDGNGTFDSATVTVDVQSVNDAVVATDDNRLDGLEPKIRLDAEPEYGSVQYLDTEGEWVEMQVGQEYPANTQMQFVPDTEDIQAGTRDIQVGSFDSDTSTTMFDGTARVEDWGIVDGDTAVYQEDGVTVTTQVNTGQLAAWNNSGSHVGAGIGNESREGLDTNEMLTVTIEGEEVNQITFQLDGLGSYFDETHSHATEVVIKAYDEQGNLIDSQGSYRDSGEYQDTYVFTTDTPVHHFTLGTMGSDGTYVVQNMTISRTVPEELQVTTIQADGSEVTNTLQLALNHNTADESLNITEQLIEINGDIQSRPIEVEEDGQLVLSPQDLLGNDTDADGDTLTITEVTATDDTHGSVELDESGNVVFTPAADYNGPASFEYTVTDGNGSFDSATVSVDVTAVNDAAEVAETNIDGTEDTAITFTQDMLLQNATDVDSDNLTAINLQIDPQYGVLIDNEDGTFTFTPAQDFHGEVPFSFDVDDNDGAISPASGSISVDAVADAPELSVTDGEGNAFENNILDTDPDDAIALNIAASLTDQDLSETLSVTIDGVPEGGVIQYDGQAVLDAQDNGLTSYVDTEVTVTFAGEGAGFKNSVGYYRIDEEGNISDVDLVYENASQVRGGGDLLPGESSFSFELEQGESFNIFVIPNGFNKNDFDGFGEGVFEFRDQEGNPASMSSTDPQLVFVGDDGSETVIRSQFGDAIFHGGSSENLNQDNFQHTHTTLNDDGQIVYGIEDWLGGGDRDYDDFMFTIDMGEENSNIFRGEILSDGETPIVLPSVAIEETIQLQLPEDFNDEFDLVVEATSTERSNNDEATTTQTIHVDAREFAPEVTGPAAASTDEDTTITITQDDLLVNASDADGDALVAQNVTTNHPDVVIVDNGNGSFDITPPQDFHGDISLSFEITDGEFITPTQMTLTVEPVNDAAVVAETNIDGTEDAAITFTQDMLLQNATDVDSDTLTAINLQIDPQYGALIDNEDGTFTFTPKDDFNGEVPFTFDVDDNDGAVTPASGTLDVAAVNDVPVFAETSYTIAEDGSITISEASLLANVTDVDNDDLCVTDISVEGSGTVTRDDETGDWTFTPDADYSGDATLKITVNDTKVDAVFNAPVTITPEADEPSLTVSLTDMSLIDFGLGQDTALTGWHTDNANNHIEIHQDYVYGVGDNRGGVIELEANRGDESNLYTNLDVKAGEVVTLEFDMSARKGWEGEDSQVDIYFEGQLIDSLAPDEIGWNHYSYQFTATTDNPKIEFDSPDDNSLGGILDSITVVKEVTEDLPTPLNIDAALSDTDGSESLASLVVDGLPDGAVLTDGDNRFTADGDDNSVDINDWDLSLLTFQGGENFHGPVSLTVTATAIEDATADNDTPETALTTATLDFNVVPVNDAVVIDANSPLQFNTDEDTQIVITEAALLANASDVDGDDLSVVNLNIANASFTTVVDPETGDKSYVVTPDQDVNGDLAISFDVTDGEGSQVASGATLQVAAVNDGPEVSANLAYTIDEDGTITLSQEQLLANASDVDGDKLAAENLQLDADGTVERNEDGSYTITPDENFNGELNLTFDVTDGQETVATGLDLTVNSVNDEVIAADDSRMSAQEPQIRLEAAPEHGTVQCMNADGEWEDMVVGREYPADAQVQFVPDTDDVKAGTRDIMVGSFDNDTSTTVFDGTASVDDWGTVDGNKAVYQEDGVTITTEVSKGDLAAWNGAGSAMGAGIGNDSRNGLSDDEYLTVTVEGEDVNQITFQLDGLGGYFDESSSKATEVIIQAFDANGNLIDSQGGYRESGELQDTYAFTTDIPVHHFTLGTEGGKGTYVVQNMTVSRTMSDEIQLTTIQADGSEDTNTLALDLNHNKADEPMDVTEQLVDIQQGITSRAIEVEEDGQLVIAPSDLLANDTDADGDVLTITAVEATDDTHGTVELDEDGNVVFTPDPDYNGPASFTYTVTDGNGSFDTATVSVDVKPVEDLPQAPTLTFDVNEDQILEIDPAFILSQASDADGDKLSLESLSLKQPPTGNLQLQQDGMYHLITPADFNGLIELDYAISDGDDVVDGSLKVDVVPVNDAPFNGGNAHLTTYEDGAFTFRAEDMLDLFGDVDGDDLVVSRVITVEGEEAGDVEQNEDGSWTFTPADDYSGTVELQVEVSDPSGATTVLDVPVYIRPVADGAVITTDHDGPLVFDEDTTGLLGLNVDMLDASEQLSHLVITGFPVGFVVSDGDNTITITEPGQVIDVTTWSFDDLSLTPPDNFNGSFFITVSATTADYGDEPSNALPEATEAYADFDTAQGETLLLTLDDLLDMAEGVETTDGDSVLGVHLIDRSQGELVDNGDGTWSFTPAEGEEGSVDFAYQVNQGGNLVAVQSSIVVTGAEAQESANSAPAVDHITTTELGSGNELSFTDADMLGQLSDTENDQLSIESVQVIGGQGVLETNSEGQYTFTPAQGFAGQAQIAFVATDGNSSIQSHFNVEVAEPEPSEFMLDEMGSLELTQSILLDALNLGEESTITAVDYHGVQGTVIEDEEGWWVFWSDDDFTGQLPLEVTSSDGETTAVHQLSLDVDEYQDPDSQSEVAESQQGDSQGVDTQTSTVDESVEVAQQEGEEADSDITAAPGNNVHFEVPDEIANNPDVEQVEISDLPEGATIANALLNGDGSYTVSGNLSKPLLMKLSNEFEGEATLQFEGQSDLGAAIDGASGSLTMDVSEEYAMQGNKGGSNPSQPAMQDDNRQNGDWTQGDNTNQGVDVMDDSASFDDDASGIQQDDSPVMDENI